MKQDDNNYYIDFYRFVFSVIILLYHSWKFTGEYGLGLCNYGFYAVDFYFIVTGYLMMKSISKENELKNIAYSTFKFVKNKYLKLFPALLVTFIFGCFFAYGREIFNIKLLLSNTLICEILQLGILGFDLTIHTSWWYISAMFFVLIILYPISIKYKDKYIYIIAPIILLFSLALINFYNIDINDPVPIKLLLRNGFYKGLIFIILGNFSFILSQKMKNNLIVKNEKVLFTIVETLIYIILILNTHFNYIGSVFVALMFTFNIALTFSKRTVFSQMFKGNFWKKLGKFGLYIYLTQMAIRDYYVKHNHYSYLKILFIYIITTFIISIICYIIVEIIWKKIWIRLKQKNA